MTFWSCRGTFGRFSILYLCFPFLLQLLKFSFGPTESVPARCAENSVSVVEFAMEVVVSEAYFAAE